MQTRQRAGEDTPEEEVAVSHKFELDAENEILKSDIANEEVEEKIVSHRFHVKTEPIE